MALGGEIRLKLKQLYPEDHFFVTNQRLTSVPKQYNDIPNDMIHQSMPTLAQTMIDGQARPPVVKTDFIRPQATDEHGQYQRLEWPAQLLNHLQLKHGKETAGILATRWVNQDIADTNREARQTRRRLEIISQARSCNMDLPKEVLDEAMKIRSLGTDVHKFTDFETSSDEDGIISDTDDEDENEQLPFDELLFPSTFEELLKNETQASSSTPLRTQNGQPSNGGPRMPTPVLTPMPSARTPEPSTDEYMEEVRKLIRGIPQLVQAEVTRSMRMRLDHVRSDTPREENSPTTTRSLSPLGRYNIGVPKQASPVNIVINNAEPCK